CAPLRPAALAGAILFAVGVLAFPDTASAQQLQSPPTWPTGFQFRPQANFGATFRPVVVRRPVTVTLNLSGVQITNGSWVRVGTTGAIAPAGGMTLLGGNSFAADGRSEFAPPVIGKVPGVNRGVKNVGTGRTVVAQRVWINGRIIDLHAEEEEQVGN